MEERRPLEIVVRGRRAVDLREQSRDVFDHRHRKGAAGVVHEDVEPAPGVDHPLYERVDLAHVLLVADPLRRALAVVVDALGCRQARQLAPRAAHDGRPLFEQLARDPDADAPARPGDDGDLSFELSHLLVLRYGALQGRAGSDPEQGCESICESPCE
jgi:hypothetical protein